MTCSKDWNKAYMITEEACKFLHISMAEIARKTRKSEISLPRQKIHWVVRQLIEKKCLSLREIGFIVGDKSHVVVHYSIKTIQGYMDVDAGFSGEMEKLKKYCNEKIREAGYE
jgi:chromosomal replication initiation ATPase DnaA